MIRELAPWQIAVEDRLHLERPGPFAGMAFAALAAGSIGLTPLRRREPVRRGLKVKPEQPRTKLVRKAQRAARKARRRGEGS